MGWEEIYRPFHNQMKIEIRTNTKVFLSDRLAFTLLVCSTYCRISTCYGRIALAAATTIGLVPRGSLEAVLTVLKPYGSKCLNCHYAVGTVLWSYGENMQSVLFFGPMGLLFFGPMGRKRQLVLGV